MNDILEPRKDLNIALSLARGNSPAIKRGARLERIAFHIERALKGLNPPVYAKTDKHIWRIK